MMAGQSMHARMRTKTHLARFITERDPALKQLGAGILPLGEVQWPPTLLLTDCQKELAAASNAGIVVLLLCNC